MVSLDLAVSMLRRVINDLSVFADGRDIPDVTHDYFILSLEFVYREMIALEATYHLSAEQCEASEKIFLKHRGDLFHAAPNEVQH